ncbi:MAG: methylglyoxal synthase [Betaproteobacteria bacterium]|nr:MAG: methylglyoxal synthase [Betaproteobacteria bacterium]
MSTIALIAHDRCKAQMVSFAREHLSALSPHQLVATRTTGGLLRSEVGLNVQQLLSGPQGGDLQIGAMIAEGRVDAVIFLRDVLTAQPHEPDISALLRICDVHNVPVATNLATARWVLNGLLQQTTQRKAIAS